MATGKSLRFNKNCGANFNLTGQLSSESINDRFFYCLEKKTIKQHEGAAIKKVAFRITDNN